MSVKSQIIQEYEEEIKKETPQTQIDISHPFNMKTFWKNINEYQFSNKYKLNPYEISHLISLFSQHCK